MDEFQKDQEDAGRVRYCTNVVKVSRIGKAGQREFELVLQPHSPCDGTFDKDLRQQMQRKKTARGDWTYATKSAHTAGEMCAIRRARGSCSCPAQLIRSR